ncbi:ABC transporter ATP-binding protein [Neisseriaceae bacterium TC5R-5]|nr:ABC transporter ATP-binding protein [Neisseriaceae bacterium TC5R-5]
MLEARQLGLSLAGQQRINNISFHAHCGELTVIVGPNGAGKSSLLKLLSGQYSPTQGQVLLAGQVLAGQNAAMLARQRAVLEQELMTPENWTSHDLIATGAYHAPHLSAQASRQAIQLSNTQAFANQAVSTLSGGERQRVHLARALCQLFASSATERYLLLDEPSSALDFAVADQLMAQIARLSRDHQIGTIAVIHDLNLAMRHADRILLMKQGEAVGFGLCRDIMQKASLEAVYGLELLELNSPDQQTRAFVPARTRHC